MIGRLLALFLAFICGPLWMGLLIIAIVYATAMHVVDWITP